MEPIEIALQDIAGLLRAILKQSEAHMQEVRERYAETDAREEAWKEEIRASYREHDRIEQERLAIDQQNATRLAQDTERAFTTQEQWRKEDVERLAQQDKVIGSLFGKSIKSIHLQEDAP